MKKTSALLLGIALTITTSAEGSVKGKSVTYRHGGATLIGYLAYDDALSGKRPGVIVVHEWKGIGDYAKRRARELASLGYVAFAIDMYGGGIEAKDHEEAARLSGIYRNDRHLMRARAKAGLDRLLRHPMTDAENVGAIGYCFGGTTILELARAGENLKGVVSFHGALSTPHPEDASQIQGKILVLHGAADPYVTQEEVQTFEKEMRAAGVDYRVIQYPGAVHSFTVKEAGDDPSRGAAYNAEADRKSWQAMGAFFEEIFQ